MVGTSGSTWCKPKFQASQEIVQCVFPDCEKVMRRDKLNPSHYVKIARVNAKVDTVNTNSREFREINNQFVKDHTEFFRHKLKPSRLPYPCRKIKKYSKSF